MNIFPIVFVSLLLVGILMVIIFGIKKSTVNEIIINIGTGASGGSVNKPGTGGGTGLFEDFPDVKGALIVGNSSNKKVNVYLDALKPPYTPKDDGCSTTAPACWSSNDDLVESFIDNIWANSKAQFYLYTGKKQTQKLTGSYTQTLDPGQFWVIVLPLDSSSNLPVWCPGLKNPVSCQGTNCGQLGCTGTGGWIESADAAIPKPKTTHNEDMFRTPQQAMRFEFNFDPISRQIYYNLSAVDGINSSLILNYNGASCPSATSSCVIDLSQCPFPENPNEIPPAWNYQTCPSPVHIDIDKSGCGQAIDCAGCGGNIDPESKCLCRKWWANNSSALSWKSFVQGKCDIYSWAYDELVLTNPNCDCSNGSCSTKPNSINPLRQCKTTSDGSLLIKILDVKT